MIASRGIRRLLFAAPCLLAASALAWASLSSAPAAPAPVPEPAPEPQLSVPAANVTYYNNMFHLVIVGRFGMDCCNNVVAWGKKTPYATTGGCFPCVPPPK